METKDYLLIDGSMGEGGGAVLRLSTAFSVIYNLPIKIVNIRANRPKPGLRLQHIIGLRILTRLTGSVLSEVQVGTRELMFTPKRDLSERLDENVKTAASIGLILQPIQIASLALNEIEQIKLVLNGGGTFGKWAPSLEYLKRITYPIFNKVGHNLHIKVLKHGWYPKGGAKTECLIIPPKQDLTPFSFTKIGDIDKILGHITITKDLHSNKSKIVERIIKSSKKSLSNLQIDNINITFEIVESISSGVSFLLWTRADNGAIVSSGTVLGEKRLPAERLGTIAAEKLSDCILNEVPVDNYLSDQLIPLMAIIQEPCKIKVREITSHTRTNLEIAKIFTKKPYSIKKTQGGCLIEL